MSDTEISDAGSLHKYGTLIPNTVVRGRTSYGLSIYAKWLYVYLKSVTGESQVCFRSTTTIARESGMSRGQVSAAKKELVTQRLITLQHGKNPRRDSDRIRLKDIWPENMQEFSVHTLNTDEEEEQHTGQSESALSVHNMNSEQQHSVHTLNTDEEEEQHTGQSESALSVHNMNSESPSVHPMNTEPGKPLDQCSYCELGVHIAAQNKIPLRNINLRRKENPPLSPQRGEGCAWDALGSGRVRTEGHPGQAPDVQTTTATLPAAPPPTRARKKTRFPLDPQAQAQLRQSIFDETFHRWFTEEGLVLDPDEQWTKFTGKAIARGYRYESWRQGFMNWLTSEYQEAARARPSRTPGALVAALKRLEAARASERALQGDAPHDA